MRLLLIRHAQSAANAAGVLSTSAPGPDLTDLGRAQALALAETFASDHLADATLDGLYVSTLARTAQTAAPLAALLAIQVSTLDGVHEIEAGDFEGSTDEASRQAYYAPISLWGDGDLTACVPGAFDGRHFLDRFDGAIRTLHERHGDGATVGVVSHAGAIKIWIGGRTRAGDPAFCRLHRLDNAGVVALEGSPDDGWRLVTWQGVPVEQTRQRDLDLDPAASAVQ